MTPARFPFRLGQNRASGIPRVGDVRAAEARLRDQNLWSAYQSRRYRNFGRTQLTEGHQTLAEAVALMSLAVQAEGGPVPYDVQIEAALRMAVGQAVEMGTGEGKTYAIVLASAALAMNGEAVHVLTANDYLAERDANVARSARIRLGLACGHVGAGLPDPQRRQVYARDIVYATADQVAFDCLRDGLALQKHEASPLRHGRPPRPLNHRYGFALIDELDHLLIDEAVTPLALAEAAEGEESPDAKIVRLAAERAAELHAEAHWRQEASTRRIALTDEALAYLRERPLAPEIACQLRQPWPEYVRQAIQARQGFARDVDYVVRGREVWPIDLATGRLQPDRHWQRGLHQAIQCKEALPLTPPPQAVAQTTRMRFFSRYHQIAGCSGTLGEASGELKRVYGLDSHRIAPRVPSQLQIWPTAGFATAEQKWNAIVEETAACHQHGRPVLLGTESIRESQTLAHRLEQANLPVQLLNGVQSADEASVIARAGRRGAITIATDMAGRGTDIPLDEAAVAFGGLHVIVCTPRSSPRIDRQMIGRAGRQGQPGSARRFVSLEDPLIQEFSPWTRRAEWLPRALGPAGRRSERRFAQARAALLETENHDWAGRASHRLDERTRRPPWWLRKPQGRANQAGQPVQHHEPEGTGR